MTNNDTAAAVPVLRQLYRNITESLAKLKDDKELVRDDRNAYLYILFVLTFYAFSIIVLMVKYIKREREGNRYENYYAEFVERKWYTDKSLYDSTGRRIEPRQANEKVEEAFAADEEESLH